MVPLACHSFTDIIALSLLFLLLLHRDTPSANSPLLFSPHWLHRDLPSANLLLFPSILSHRDVRLRDFYIQSFPHRVFLLWLHRDYPLRTFGFTEAHPLRTLLSFSLCFGFTETTLCEPSASQRPTLCELSSPFLFALASR